MESPSYGAYIVSREIMSEQAILGPDVSVYYEGSHSHTWEALF